MTSIAPSSPNPKPTVGAVTAFADAGFDEVAVVPIGDDHEGFSDGGPTTSRPQSP